MITKVVNVNLHQPIYERLTAKQGDIASRYLLFHLLDGDKPFDLSNRTVRVYAIKPDKTEIFNDLTINDASKGYCTLELTSQCLASAGVVKMELYISESGKVLTSIPFELEVIACINTANSVTSTNEFSALEIALSSLQDYNNLRSEIIQARKGHEAVGERLDNFDSQLERIDIKKANKDDVAKISSGTPLFAPSTTGMTDTTKNYVNTTDGYLYIYSDGNWINSNVKYQSNGIADKSVTERKLDRLYADGVVGENKFNKDTVTLDRYIDGLTGNLHTSETFFLSDYIKIEPNTTYYINGISPWQAAFYDSNLNYIWGSNTFTTTFTTESTDVYMRFSCNQNELTTKMISKSTITEYKPYGHFVDYENLTDNLKNIIINKPTVMHSKKYCTVSKDGIGNFTTIQEGINYIDEGGVVYVLPGEYEETIDTRNKEVDIIGVDKKRCVLWCQTGDYYLPPLEATCGYFANMTFYAKNNGTAQTLLPYSVHIDFDYEVGKQIEFFNCDFISEHGACVGMGTRKDFKAIFRNCLFNNTKEMASHGAFYFHDWNQNSLNETGEAYVYLENCNIRSNSQGVMVAYPLGMDGVKTCVTLINNTFWSIYPTANKQNFITLGGGATGSDWLGSKGFILTGDSHGNNLDYANA